MKVAEQLLIVIITILVMHFINSLTSVT